MDLSQTGGAQEKNVYQPSKKRRGFPFSILLLHCPSSSCQILDPSQVFHNIGDGDVKPISPLIGKMSLPFTAWRLSSHLHEMIYLQKNNNFWQHCGNHHWLMFDGNLVLCMALTNPIHDAQPEWQFTVIEKEKSLWQSTRANILKLWPFEMPDSLSSVHATEWNGSSSFWHFYVNVEGSSALSCNCLHLRF